MPDAPAMTTPAPALTRHLWVAVVCLLALYAGQTLLAATHKGASFDEGEELAMGYDVWRNHDFRMEVANGDLVKRWSTLPFLFSQPHFPGPDDPLWRAGKSYEVAYQFLFNSDNDEAALLRQGRIMVALLGVATGLLVFWCARAAAGPLAGLVALALFSFSPHMLAFGGIVSTEMSLCLTLLGSTWCIWQLLHRVTWGRLGASLVFLALLFLAKPSALVIFPITAVLLALKLASGRPLEWALGRPRVLRARAAQMAVFAGMIVLHGLVTWSVLWANYDFRYSASPHPDDPGIALRSPVMADPIMPWVSDLLDWSRRTHFFPEGYIQGIYRLVAHNDSRDAFMNGEWTVGGWTAFFPYAMWVKTSPLLFLLLILGLGRWWGLRRARPHRAHTVADATAQPAAPSFYNLLPFATLAMVYFCVAMAQDMNIGHRHILPIYPALYILAGAAAAVLWTNHGPRVKALLALLMLAFVGEAVAIYPDYLAYFNPLVGGAQEGYKHLVESSLDWGMNLPELKQWLDEHNPGGRQTVFLAYFGTDNPDYYHLNARRLPSYPDWTPRDVFPLTPGLYAISATLLQSVYMPAFGPWNRVYEKDYQNSRKNLQIYNEAVGHPDQRAALLAQYHAEFFEREYDTFDKLRFARLCAWLRHRDQPDAEVGHSILLWNLTQADLDAALDGPPVELQPAPLTNPFASTTSDPVH